MREVWQRPCCLQMQSAGGDPARTWNLPKGPTQRVPNAMHANCEVHLHGEVLGRLVDAHSGGVLRVAAAERGRELVAQVHHQCL